MDTSLDSETFKRAQQIMKANRIKYKCEPGKKNYIFTSKIQCGICGKNYKHKDRSGRSTWVCSNHRMEMKGVKQSQYMKIT